MSDTHNTKGSCLCGTIQFTTKNINKKFGACHCSMCRKWAGGPLLAVECGSEVTFTGSENIKVYNSSEWAERGFCSLCGSHLFYRLKENNLHIIPIGLFDNGENFVFDHQVFIDDKPNYYDFSNQTKNMTGAEVFAQFSPEPK